MLISSDHQYVWGSGIGTGDGRVFTSKSRLSSLTAGNMSKSNISDKAKAVT